MPNGGVGQDPWQSASKVHMATQTEPDEDELDAVVLLDAAVLLDDTLVVAPPAPPAPPNPPSPPAPPVPAGKPLLNVSADRPPQVEAAEATPIRIRTADRARGGGRAFMRRAAAS